MKVDTRPCSGRLREFVPLAPATTLELGGAARYFIELRNEADVSEAIGWASSQRLPVCVLGSGSNVVVADQGFDGLVLRMAIGGMRSERSSRVTRVSCGAGLSLQDLVAWSVREGLCGLECLAGIPGTVGAAPVQNVGAYGQEIAGVIESLCTVDLRTGRVRELQKQDCEFAHRNSLFKRCPSLLITRVTVRFENRAEPSARHPDVVAELGSEATTVNAVHAAVIRVRRRKSMLLDVSDPNHRSVGSFFISPEVSAAAAESVVESALRRGTVRSAAEVPVYDVGAQGRRRIAGGWLVEQAGFRKGHCHGRVGISTRHALALVHHGGGSTIQLVELASQIQRRVEDAFGITLAPEPTFVGLQFPRRNANGELSVSLQ